MGCPKVRKGVLETYYSGQGMVLAQLIESCSNENKQGCVRNINVIVASIREYMKTR